MSNLTSSVTRSSALSGGPSDCAIARSFDFRLQMSTGTSPGCCPGIDDTDIECNVQSRVVKVAASEQGTRGPIPSKIGELTELVKFYAFGNRMPGELPKGIGNLKSLTHLVLYENELSNSLPNTLVNLKLEVLRLENNKFAGPVPLLPNAKDCTIVSGPNDGNKFTCLLGDPTKHIGPCYDNLRATGVTQLCPSSTTATSASATSTPPPENDSAALLIAAVVGGVAVALVALFVLGVALYRRRQASIADGQPSSAEMGLAALGPSFPPLLGGDGLLPTTPLMAVPAQAAEQEQFQDLWSSPKPTDFPPPLPVLAVDDGKPVEEILDKIERERAASRPWHP